MRSSLAITIALATLANACGGDDGGDTPTDDAGAVDAPGDGPSPIDAAIDAAVDAAVDARPITGLNNCSVAMAADRTEPQAPRTVSFNAGVYSPACLKIKVGQAVTWSGDLGVHPLRPGQFGGGNQPGNPITATSSGSSLMVTFPAAGDFGYYCDTHGPGGMMGAIFVIP
jgi:plastocyanin